MKKIKVLMLSQNDKNILCPICGNRSEPIFGEYMECTRCKHIFQRDMKPIKPICPNCGSIDYTLLFGDMAECKKCKHVFELKQGGGKK